MAAVQSQMTFQKQAINLITLNSTLNTPRLNSTHSQAPSAVLILRVAREGFPV